MLYCFTDFGLIASNSRTDFHEVIFVRSPVSRFFHFLKDMFAANVEDWIINPIFDVIDGLVDWYLCLLNLDWNLHWFVVCFEEILLMRVRNAFRLTNLAFDTLDKTLNPVPTMF